MKNIENHISISFEVNYLFDENVRIIQVIYKVGIIKALNMHLLPKKMLFSLLTHLVYKVVFGKCYVSVIMGIS